MNCLFCNIAAGNIPASVVFEDSQIIAFHDIKPQAPTHILIIPKEHIATINDTSPTHAQLLGQMIITAKTLAQTHSLDAYGYRLVFNVNAGGGQEVFHIHLHLIGGRQMTWPPG
jgi:histidine triad (HIT) family protein